jgi:tripartite-type tricarboxylate transporter receptor subunit TctC
LLGGQTQLVFGTIASCIELIRTGKLRALGVTTAMRSRALPDVPTLGEYVPGYEGYQWYGLGAPKNTPAAIVNMLNSEINASLADSKLIARLADLGVNPMSTTAANFGKLITEETEKWGKVILASNLAQ